MNAIAELITKESKMKTLNKKNLLRSSFIRPYVLLILLFANSLVFANDEQNKADIIGDRLVIAVAKPSKDVVAKIVDDRIVMAENMLNKLDISEDDKVDLLNDYSQDLESSITSLFDDYYDQMIGARQDNIEELDRAFTTQEIEQIVSFFDSAIGQKYFQISGQQAQITQQLGQEFQTSLSQDITSKLDDFINATKQVSNTNSGQ